MISININKCFGISYISVFCIALADPESFISI